SPPFAAGCCRCSRVGTTLTQRFSPIFWTHARSTSSFANGDNRPFLDQIEELDHVRIAHPDATVTVRRADRALVFRSVNVNKSVVRIRVALAEAIEPHDPRSDEIFRLRQRIVRPERHA